MITIPFKKIKSRTDTITHLLDPARLKAFILDLREYLRGFQHLCQKKGYGDDPRQCIHHGYHESPESVPFRRFIHFCYQRGLDWEGAREAMEIMLSTQFSCDCEMLWKYTDEKVGEILEGRRR